MWLHSGFYAVERYTVSCLISSQQVLSVLLGFVLVTLFVLLFSLAPAGKAHQATLNYLFLWGLSWSQTLPFCRLWSVEGLVWERSGEKSLKEVTRAGRRRVAMVTRQLDALAISPSQGNPSLWSKRRHRFSHHVSWQSKDVTTSTLCHRNKVRGHQGNEGNMDGKLLGRHLRHKRLKLELVFPVLSECGYDILCFCFFLTQN